MNVTVPVYQRRNGGSFFWTTLGLGRFTREARGNNMAKLQEQLVEALRNAVEAASPGELPAFDLKKGTHLRRVRLELTVIGDGKKKRVSGLAPLVVEPRAASDHRGIEIVYHPLNQAHWFVRDPLQSLETQANAFLNHALRALSEAEAEALFTDGKDLIRAVAFSARPKTLLDTVASNKRGLWDDLLADPAQKQKKKSGGMRVLSTLGVDRTTRRVGDGAGLGTPRSPYREQLQMLLGAASEQQRRSVLVVGPPGCGKTTIIERFVDDLLNAEDFSSHRNYDKVTHVWEITGKRIIAGMSYVGEWEQRVGDLVEDVRGKKRILYVPDIAAFGRIGQARDSTRALADVLRSPVARGEVILLGECTEEQLARLEQDAPTFAALFTRVHVREASLDESFRMVLAAARAMEAERDVRFEPMALRTLLELGSALVAHRALPGKALELLAHLPAWLLGSSSSRGAAPAAVEVSPEVITGFLGARTGLPSHLLERDKPIERKEVEEDLEERVIGQPDAVRVAADLVLRIRSGLADPKRPYGVYLFTGPTGTGKTELAKALAVALYGSEERLLRFDMGEYGAPDAAARLVGDAWNPDGALTRALREQPFCVVLFDEVEKAHPSVLNLFLQAFEDGRLTDAAGNVASFRHAVIVMTSNLGARRAAPVGFGQSGESAADEARVKENVAADVSKAVREFFPPELFNRIDRVVPFSPLSHEVAIDVAQKELGKLLARRGLSSRQIFVQANRAVVERVAADAFKQRDGARSLKRFLEDQIGGVIGEQIARSPAAALRVMHLFARGRDGGDEGGGFVVDQEALEEATPIALKSVLEPLLDLDAESLEPHVRAVLPELERIEQGEALSAIAEAIRKELAGAAATQAVFHLDALRARVRSLHERLEHTLMSSRELDREALERKHFHHEVFETGSKFTWSRRRMRVLAEAPQERRSATRRDLLALLADVTFLRRAIGRAHDPTRHAATIEIVPLAPFGGGTSRHSLARALIVAWQALLSGGHRGDARGEIDGFAALHDDGRVDIGSGKRLLATIDEPGARIVHLALHAVGPCVLDLLEDETGTHVLEPVISSTRGDPPELVRVRVGRVDPERSLRDLAEAHQRRRTEFERSVFSDGAPSRAFPALPVVRRIQRSLQRGNAPVSWSIEDYRVAYADSVVARGLDVALEPLFLLRLSRQEGAREDA